MNHRHQLRLAFTCSLLMSAVPVVADQPQSTGPARAETKSGRVVSPDVDLRRTRVSRDPVTGQIEITRGSGIGVRSLSPREQNMLSRSDEGLESTVLPNGAVTVNLRGRFQSMATATSHSGGGELTMSCAIDDDASSFNDQPPDGP